MVSFPEREPTQMQSETKTPPLSQLAKMIELDINRRGLMPGDPYLTSDEVGRQFGANSRTASRAMTQLADLQKLVRRRGSGTFVGPGFESATPTSVGTLYVLVSNGRLLTGMPIDQMIVELSNRLVDCQIRLAVLPETDQRPFVGRLLETGADGAPVQGVVLVGCPREVHEVVAESGTAAVVFGTVHATSKRLASADADHRAMGEIAARYLAERGCEKVAVVLRDRWLPGDNQFLDGVNDALAASGVNHGSPILRSLPAQHDAIVAETAQMLGDDDYPTGIICRGRLFAESVLEAISGSGLDVGDDVHVIANLDGSDQGATLPIPAVTAETEYADQIAILAKLLRDQIEGTRHDDEHVVLPVKLINHKRLAREAGA